MRIFEIVKENVNLREAAELYGMLHEDMERQAVRRMMRRAQEGQQIPQKKKDKGQER